MDLVSIEKVGLKSEKVNTSPIKAIRAKCLDCCCGSVHEVKMCSCVGCALYAFRFGKNPYLHREMTEEQKAAAAERLRKAREDKKENGN